MKKLIKLLLILLTTFTIVSCGKKDYKEGELVELSAQELTNNFAGDNAKDFIFATVNETKQGYREFLIDLEKYAKESKKAIYYIYYNHIDTASAMYIFNLFEADFTSNAYHVVEEGQITLTQAYKDYTTMEFYLKDKRFFSLLTYTSEKEVKEQLKLAQEEYDKGNVSVSLNHINKIWNRKEAKEFYDTHEELGIVKSWEHFIITEGKTKKITYRSLLFHHNTNYFLEILAKGDYEKFEKPKNMMDYTQTFYYVKDDIIYTATANDKDFTKRFKIKGIEKTSLILYDYKYKKEFTYTRRV